MMTQNTFTHGIHVGLILDGNGRWAEKRKLPRVAGHRAGAHNVRKIVEVAPNYGISILTLYAFSSDNWKRPGYEVSALMKLFGDYLRSETARCVSNGIRMSIIGRRDRLSKNLIRQIENAEKETIGCQKLHLRIALDYSARDMLLYAAQELQNNQEHITAENLAQYLSGRKTEPVPDIDLLIRTSGEQRLSDFMLWECAYAEFVFAAEMWPDYSPSLLQAAVQEFKQRERRFGGLNTISNQVVAG